MTAEGSGWHNPAIGDGHHSGGGRNVLSAVAGHEDGDIFHAAVQMSRMPMVLADPNQPDFPLVFANHAFCELTGYPVEEIVGRNCRFLQGEATDRAAVARIAAALASGQDITEEIYNYRKDGTGFWNALFMSHVYGSDGSLRFIFASQLDVTRRKEAEAVLQQSQRMEALGAMASGVAHEFNNLMTVVVGSVQQATERATDDRQRRQLERADWASRQAGRLTQQMLSFSRRQFLDNRRVDLNEVVGSLDGLLAQVLGKDVRLTLDLAPGAVWATLDLAQLELALINLARNARDAMAGRGGTFALATRDSGDGAELSVADTGIGMSEEVLKRATEPFYTTKARGEGTGLGLSMVQGFCAQSGGTLALESAPGRGTTARLRFPAEPAAAAPRDGRGEAGRHAEA